MADYSIYPLIFKTPASNEQILQLQSVIGKPIPNDYLEFLRFSNGADGTYVCIFEIEIVLLYYSTIKLEIPGFVIIGSDGGGEAYGYDFNDDIPEIKMLPFIGGLLENAIKFGKSFENFLRQTCEMDDLPSHMDQQSTN